MKMYSYFILSFLSLPMSFNVVAQLPVPNKPTTSGSGFSLTVRSPFSLPASTTSGSAGSAAVAQPSMADAGIATADAIKAMAAVMSKNAPDGITLPKALSEMASALKLMNQGKPEDGGLARFAQSVTHVSESIRIINQGNPKDGGMHKFSSALKKIAQSIENIGINPKTIRELNELLEKTKKCPSPYTCIATTGGLASAYSIPLHGATLSNVCCLIGSLAMIYGMSNYQLVPNHQTVQTSSMTKPQCASEVKKPIRRSMRRYDVDDNSGDETPEYTEPEKPRLFREKLSSNTYTLQKRVPLSPSQSAATVAVAQDLPVQSEESADSKQDSQSSLSAAASSPNSSDTKKEK